MIKVYSATGTAINDATQIIQSCPGRTYQAVGTTTSGAGTATVKIEVSNDGTNWLEAGEIVLSFTTTADTDGVTVESPWKFHRMRISAISGTGASVGMYVAHG